jgi:hypothetical protein
VPDVHPVGLGIELEVGPGEARGLGLAEAGQEQDDEDREAPQGALEPAVGRGEQRADDADQRREQNGAVAERQNDLADALRKNKLVAAVIAVSILTVAGGAILSIYFLNAKLREANAEYLVVGQQLGVANRREQEAKLEADIARAERARAEDSLAKIQLALDAPKSTPEQITGRPVEGEAEGRSHEDAEPPGSQLGEFISPVIRAPDHARP